MASNVSDRLLLTAIVVSGVAACWYLPYVLRQVKEATAVSLPPPKTNKPELAKDAEAAIKPSTLAELADGPSYNLAASAIRLTTAKFLKSNAKKTLLKDLASTDYRRRDKAINALRLLLTNTALKDHSIRHHLNNEATFNALVTALVNLLPEHRKAPKTDAAPPSPVRPAHRSAHEAALLFFVGILINEPRKDGTSDNRYYVRDAQLAINAGIITRWLKHYPFPCTLSENRRWNFKRHDVCRLLHEEVWGSDDEPMSALFLMLLKVPDGPQQLADVGFLKSIVHKANVHARHYWRYSFDVAVSEPGLNGVGNEHEFEDDEVEEGQLIDDDEMMARLQQTPQLRSGRTAGERSLRRRHRQAVVVAEAGMPLSEENILQRHPTETELNWEEEITGRQGEILRDRSSRGNANRRSASAEYFGHAVDQIARERIDGIEDNVAGGVWEGPVPPGIDLGDPEWHSESEFESESETDADSDSGSNDQNLYEVE